MSDEKSLNDRLAALAAAALERTLSGQLKWRTTDDEDAFLFSGTRTSMIVDRYPTSGIHELRILNDRGILIDKLQTSSSIEQAFGESRPAWNDTLKSLYDAARRSALDVDAVIDAALQDVQQAGDED